MGHPNFTQPASSPPPLGYPACSASAPCARRLPCRGPLGCRFRNLALPCHLVTRPQVVTAQRSLNVRATVCWRLLEGGDRQNLLLNGAQGGALSERLLPLAGPTRSPTVFGPSTALNVPSETARTASRRSRAQTLVCLWNLPLNG